MGDLSVGSVSGEWGLSVGSTLKGLSVGSTLSIKHILTANRGGCRSADRGCLGDLHRNGPALFPRQSPPRARHRSVPSNASTASTTPSLHRHRLLDFEPLPLANLFALATPSCGEL